MNFDREAEDRFVADNVDRVADLGQKLQGDSAESILITMVDRLERVVKLADTMDLLIVEGYVVPDAEAVAIDLRAALEGRY